MTGLIYTTGPSGAGKDSVLAWLKSRLPAQAGVHFAQRCIDRARTPGDEAHEALDSEAFVALQNANAFGMYWQANGRHYGIRHAELAGPAGTRWVIVNGSRGYLQEALRTHPTLQVLHITASPGVLAQRLSARGRESSTEILARLQRQPELPAHLSHAVLEVRNDGSLEETGMALLASLSALPGWA